MLAPSKLQTIHQALLLKTLILCQKLKLVLFTLNFFGSIIKLKMHDELCIYMAATNKKYI